MWVAMDLFLLLPVSLASTDMAVLGESMGVVNGKVEDVWCYLPCIAFTALWGTVGGGGLVLWALVAGIVIGS